MPTTSNPPVPAGRGYLADIYTFDWKQLSFRTSLIGIIPVGLCLFGGVAFGHPSAGLIAGGGAFTIGFGVNQRIADSRLWPMIAATGAVFLSTMIGMLVGHRGFTLVLAAAIWGFIYGILTARAAGISWVGQQSAITLFVASAFPASFQAKPAPFGVGFTGTACTEPRLIELAYAFEQATKRRITPATTP